jgi:dTDP-glucose 4,6-dehydratase
VICVDNLETGTLQNIEHIRDPERFVHLNLDIIDPYFVDEPIDFVYHLASPGLPDRPASAAARAEGQLYGTHHTLGLARSSVRLPDRLHRRGLRRSTRTSAVESYWGHVSPIGRAGSTTRPSATPRR